MCVIQLAAPQFARSVHAPLRGTTLGRDCTTWGGLAPARPTMPVGLSSAAAVRAGIGTPLVDEVVVTVPDAAGPVSVAPMIGAGTDPCHTGGTDIAPIRRARPRLAEIDELRPPSPVIIRMAGAV